MSWSDLAFLSSVRSALEVAVVGFVVIIIFFELQKRPPNETLILQRQRHPGLPPPSSPRILQPILSAGLGFDTSARRRPSSVVVVGVGGGCGCRLSSCRPSHTGRRYRSSSSFLTLSKGARVERGGVIYACPRLLPSVHCVGLYLSKRRRSHRGPLVTATD